MVDAAHARELIARSIARHGGDRWSRIERLTLRPRAAVGAGPLGEGERADVQAAVARRARAADRARDVLRLPARRRAGRVRGRPGRAGRCAARRAPREVPRASRKLRRWQPLDALYFFGYALTHYHAMPWTLRDAEPLALRRTGRRGHDDDGFALTVRFPPSVHTHSPVQTVYFDPDGLIVRHDYVADIVGSLARGAHFWRDYLTVEGIPHRQPPDRLRAPRPPTVAARRARRALRSARALHSFHDPKPRNRPASTPTWPW